MKGKVKFYKDIYCYGFAEGEDGKDYYINESEIIRPGYRTLSEGEMIQFTPGITAKGRIAREIVPFGLSLIDKESFQGKDTVHTIIKSNPFTPQDPITNPSKFVGRKDSLLNAIDALYNGKNILIEGARGIGKSSLALQLLYVTQGETELLNRLGIDLGDFEFFYITGDHRCLPENNLTDIANGLISTMQLNLGKFSQTTTTNNTFSLDAKLVGLKSSSKSEPISPSDLSVAFVASTKKILKEYGYEAQGITFLIDEIDVLKDRVDLASFLKATIEKFRLDSFFRINFIISGVTGITTNLFMQHPSSGRLVEHLVIPRMSLEELLEIIDTALNDTPVTISLEAKRRIAKLSNEFPQPVHLLGYHSYRLDSDNIINNTDLDKAIKFITTNMRQQHFRSNYDRISGGIQTEVIKVMAGVDYEIVNIPFLCYKIPERSDLHITNALSDLGERLGIVEEVDIGQFRFSDPLFKIYLRLLFRID